MVNIRKIEGAIEKRRFVKILIKEIDAKYKKLKTKRKLSDDQKLEIQAYYKERCGHKVPYSWHRFMYSRTGIYTKEYVPVALYRSELLPRMNRDYFADAYADKNVSDFLFPNVRQPRTLLKNMNGYFYSEDGPITRDEALSLCNNLNNMIVKPSLESRGVGVRLLNVKNGNTNVEGMTIGQLFDSYGQDFLIQEKVKQHPDMERLNPSSANTIRLLTFRKGMDIFVLYTVIRIGKQGMVIDNESQGGISAKINKDGTLAKYAYGAPGNDMVERTDTGIVLEGYRIPFYEKVVDAAKQAHYHLPYFNIAAWDFCVDYEGEPLMIEWNARPDLSQTANGPAFGEYADVIWDGIYDNPNTRNIYW